LIELSLVHPSSRHCPLDRTATLRLRRRRIASNRIPMAPKHPSVDPAEERSLIHNIQKKLQLVYYQYSVTLPIYQLHPCEKIVVHSLFVASMWITVRLALYLLGGGIYGLRLLIRFIALSMRELGLKLIVDNVAG
jgi:hypothetical protein